MWELTASFPRQLREGVKSVPRHTFAERPGLPIALGGMGGSGIAGELLANMASATAEAAIVPVRDFALPAWAQNGSPVVCVSYSGNTAETLALFREAGRRGLPRAVIASGGDLITAAQKEGVLAVQVPAGQPPRASLGYLLGALVGVLRHVLPSIERELPRVAEGLEARKEEFSGRSGRAAGLAEAWGTGRELWVYAPEPLSGVARRWKTQAEENAKVLGHFDLLPELLHNAVVAWDQVAREEGARRFVALLRESSEPVERARQTDFLSRLLRERGVAVEEVRATSRGRLAEVLELVWLGDYLSLWSARARQVDPLPVPVIQRMKTELALEPSAASPRAR